jgi:hypothetical protein
MTTLELLRAKRDALLEISRRFGARNVRVFGSVIRNEDTADSDVDFLVDMEQGRSLLDLVGLQQELQKLLGRTVDVLTERGINKHLKNHILREAKPL